MAGRGEERRGEERRGEERRGEGVREFYLLMLWLRDTDREMSWKYSWNLIQCCLLSSI
jgi:hypothetical protein